MGRGQGQAPLPAWKVTGVVREPQPTGALGHLQPGDADTAGPRHSGKQIHTPVWVGLQVRYCFPGGSAGKECRRPQFDSGIRKIRRRRDRLPTPAFLGFPTGSADEESTCNEGALGSIPGVGRSSEKGAATHSSILAWRIPWTVESTGCKESDTTEWLSPFFFSKLGCRLMSQS